MSSSYCWTETSNITWQIYPVFAANQLILLVNSQTNLSHTILQLTCSFLMNLQTTTRTDHSI